MTLLGIPLLVPRLILMARASNVVYEPNLDKRRAALEALGFSWMGVIQKPSRDVTCLAWMGDLAPAGGVNLSVTQGTCFTQNMNPDEIFADIQALPRETPYGIAPDEFWQPIPDIAVSLRQLGNPVLPWHHTGHSLGGQTAQLLLNEIPGTAWPINPPTGTSHAMWKSIHANPVNENIVLVHRAEFAHGYLDGLDWHQDTPFLWLRDDLTESNGRSGININVHEHFIQPTIDSLLALKVAV